MPAPSSLGLTLLWDMETLTDDGKMKDLSGNGFHGTVAGTVSKQGKVSLCRAFPSGDNVAVTTSPLAGTSNFTMAAWYKPTSETRPTALTIGTNIPTSHAISYGDLGYLNGETKKFQFLGTIGGGAKVAMKYTTYATGAFHHVAMTYDGVTLIGYIDGSLATSLATTGTYTFRGASVGSSAGVPMMWIDEFRLYNRALSASEILDLYLSVDRNDLHDPLADMLRDWKRKWRTILPRD